MKIFADTSALIAILIEKDEFHDQAVNFSQNGYNLITSSWVIEEFIAHLHSRYNTSAAKQGIKFIRNLPDIKIQYLTSKMLTKCFNLYYKHGSQRMTLVDISNIIIMKQTGLNKIFTFDNQFQTKFNLQVVPKLN